MHRIFGPVPSRRLGRSLGIDIIPYKTCTFDCVYCECGATTDKICERREFFPLEEITGELETRLSEMPSKPDVLTLSGAGEPTLYSRMGELITEIKRTSSIPVAVITNSSLLLRSDVREELLEADIVLPSLDTALESTFKRLNRPHETCRLDGIIEGLEIFLRRFRGRVLFEVLLVSGYNTDRKNLTALKNTLRRFRLDRIQLNTAVRPGTVKEIEPLDAKTLEKVRSLLGPKCEVIAETPAPRTTPEDRASEKELISLLERRPCTAHDIHNSLGIPLPAVVKLLTSLSERRIITSEIQGEKIFYTATRRRSS